VAMVRGISYSCWPVMFGVSSGTNWVSMGRGEEVIASCTHVWPWTWVNDHCVCEEEEEEEATTTTITTTTTTTTFP